MFSPDSQTVYITLGDYNASTGVTTPNNQLLVHSQFTGWYSTTSSQATTDVALGVPYVGAFFGGNPDYGALVLPGDDDHDDRRNVDDFVDDDQPLLSRCRCACPNDEPHCHDQ